MKNIILVLCCIIYTLKCVNGDLNFFGSIASSIKKTTQDVKDVIFFNDDNDDDSQSTTKETPVTSTNNDEISTSTLPSTTTLSSNNEKPSNTTEKEGKENFSGGCLTGYMRTADGRCKPTF